jgi:hypothetical protein
MLDLAIEKDLERFFVHPVLSRDGKHTGGSARAAPPGALCADIRYVSGNHHLSVAQGLRWQG